jgi:hypothetical protein
MLHSLDLLIGVTTVMMVLSMVVTMLTQLVIDLLRLRWIHLREGIAEILMRAGAEERDVKQLLQDSPLRHRASVTVEELSAFAQNSLNAREFESVMNAVSQRFTTRSRALVLGVAALVAAALPLDILALIRAFYAGEGVVLFPETLRDWTTRWSHVNAVGVALSAVLLSLGAPAWFALLKDLLRLRGEPEK